jgi:hypothetical protein
MIQYIFRRENQYDLERIEVELVSFQSHSIKIRQGKEIVSLTWDGEFEYSTLCKDDILLIYINGNDYSKGYVLPIVQGFSSSSFDTSLIIKSELDKLKQGHKKELDAMAEILKNVIEYYSGRSIDDYKFFLDVLRSSATENESFELLRNLVNAQKSKVSNTKEPASDRVGE